MASFNNTVQYYILRCVYYYCTTPSLFSFLLWLQLATAKLALITVHYTGKDTPAAATIYYYLRWNIQHSKNLLKFTIFFVPKCLSCSKNGVLKIM